LHLKLSWGIILNNIINFLYPDRCPACRRVIEGQEYLHPECGNAFKTIKEPRCFKCGRRLDTEETDICFQCRENKHSYEYGFAVFEYNETARNAMIDYKKNGWRRNGDFFADEAVKNIGSLLAGMKPEVLIPVPVTKQRRGERGFNQSEYIAERVGERLNIPVDTDILVRRGKLQQKTLSASERRENAKTAFECVGEVPYRRVCIVDDVYTTGSTIEGCSLALKRAGVEETGFMVIFSGVMY